MSRTAKQRRWVVARTYLVERHTTVAAVDAAAALEATKGYKYNDFDETADWNDIGETSVFVDYHSTLQSKLP